VRMTLDQLKNLALAAGFAGQDIAIAAAIAIAESGGDPNAIGDNGHSFGLWQINRPSHPEFDGIDLSVPSANVWAAHSVWKQAGGSFRPWSTFTNGAYQQFLDGTVPAPSSGVDSNCHPPTSIDPVIAQVARDQLTQFIQSGAKYGAVNYVTINGQRYAFRFSEHPPDAGIAAPHPGVDYLVCVDPNAGGVVTQSGSQELSIRKGLPALAIAGLFVLLLAKK